jgi:NAD(P)-dependent dehydrogenase (short-subunit alcohol dehydrogenase family)
MDLMKNKVVLVTGAASGIGRESALALAREGANVCVADVDAEGGEETTQEIIDAGGKAIFVSCDVTSSDDVNAMVKATVETFGRLDAAVNNAGISGAFTKRIHEYDDDMFDHIMSINVKGVWMCMKAELPIMLEQGSGSIVNMASVAGLIGATKGAAYTASKHAVVGMTKSAALEYAKFGLRVNSICPSYTDTSMVTAFIEETPAMQNILMRSNPMRRLGQPTEIAEGVLWLCSDASSFVTGHQLVLDGGLTAT